MKKIVVSLFAVCAFLTNNAQNTIKIGNNEVELKGVKFNEINLIPTKSTELGAKTKEVTYYWDGTPKTFTQVTYNKNNGPTANIYTYNQDVKFKPTITTVKSKIYRGGVAYIMYLNCNKKVCASYLYYDSFSDEPTANNDATIGITFATRARAAAFAKGITNPM